jgi:hypothetical protein
MRDVKWTGGSKDGGTGGKSVPWVGGQVGRMGLKAETRCGRMDFGKGTRWEDWILNRQPAGLAGPRGRGPFGQNGFRVEDQVGRMEFRKRTRWAGRTRE